MPTAQRAAGILDTDTTTRPAADDMLVLPLHRRMVLQRLTGDSGSTELHLFYGSQVVTFDDPAMFGFAETLAATPRFRAGDAAAWTSEASWATVQPLLEQLLDAGILALEHEHVAAATPLAPGSMVRPNPLPASTCPFARSWADSESITRDLTGRAVEPGYLELIVPIFRVAHTALDTDDRQVGEANVFPRALRLDRPTTWVTCAYEGTRYMNERPMNVTALKAMRLHWKQMMAILREVRTAFLRHVPGAADSWTIGHVERLAVFVLSVPTYQLVKRDQPVSRLHPALSNVFRVTDGLRMAMHQMLFVPIGEPARSPNEPVTPEMIFDYAERNYSFHSEHGVCAGPKHMVQQFLRVLLHGDGHDADVRFDEPVAAALADMDEAFEYGMLALQAHAAYFSLWPAMTRTYESLADIATAAVAHGNDALVPFRDRFTASVRGMKRGTYLATEEWRQQRDLVYADMFEQCGRALGESGVSTDLRAMLERVSNDGHTDMANAVTGALTRRFLHTDADHTVVRSMTDTLMDFFVRTQAIFRTATAVQARINTHLGRPMPSRPFGTAEADVHNLLQGAAERRLPYLVDELREILDLDVSVDSRHMTLVDRHGGDLRDTPGTGMSPDRYCAPTAR